jgi:hypothetical protein
MSCISFMGLFSFVGLFCSAATLATHKRRHTTPLTHQSCHSLSCRHAHYVGVCRRQSCSALAFPVDRTPALVPAPPPPFPPPTERERERERERKREREREIEGEREIDPAFATGAARPHSTHYPNGRITRAITQNYKAIRGTHSYICACIPNVRTYARVHIQAHARAHVGTQAHDCPYGLI